MEGPHPFCGFIDVCTTDGDVAVFACHGCGVVDITSMQESDKEVARGIFFLQAMMKDQFANYVVQKVLETCDESQRELLLGRIRVHLHALKKYTYGKHIVARVEKLVAAGGEYAVVIGERVITRAHVE